MSAAVVILPLVWATEERFAPEAVGVVERREAAPEMAFYRKYTEALLRRYVRLSMEAGRVPSLLGKEMFRGKVTNYRVQGFDDVVIFVHDVEMCLAKLDAVEQELIDRGAAGVHASGGGWTAGADCPDGSTPVCRDSGQADEDVPEETTSGADESVSRGLTREISCNIL